MDFNKISFERGGAAPLYEQLRAALEEAIKSGGLAAGERLPSERDLCARLALSRTTVVAAYRELESRGLVRSHVGRGTFVCATPEPAGAPFAWRGKVAAGAAHLNDSAGLRQLLRGANDPDLISFAVGSPAFECFPVEDYLRLTERALRRHAADALGIAPTEGQPRLRRAIGERFGTKPEKVLVLSGSQQGIDLIARCLIDPGDRVVVDRPGYVGAIQTFRAAGATLVGWDAARADFDELEDLLVRYRPKLIYTDPTFQNPTGRVMTQRERQDLLKLAARYRTPVVEDDPWSETYLDGQPPPPPLYHLDPYSIVIHLGTFSKTLAPGLRLGWLAASEYIVDQLAAIKQHENLFTEGLGQFVIADFLLSGRYDEHMDALRREHARKRGVMRAALGRAGAGPRLSFNEPRGGLNFWCRLPAGVEARPLLEAALAAGVAFAPGELFYPDAAGRGELRLCFTSAPAARIEEGVRRLHAALASVAGKSAGRGALRMPVV
jgi:DNA-binding transcriptional MocR family regulator